MNFYFSLLVNFFCLVIILIIAPIYFFFRVLSKIVGFLRISIVYGVKFFLKVFCKLIYLDLAPVLFLFLELLRDLGDILCYVGAKMVSISLKYCTVVYDKIKNYNFIYKQKGLCGLFNYFFCNIVYFLNLPRLLAKQSIFSLKAKADLLWFNLVKAFYSRRLKFIKIIKKAKFEFHKFKYETTFDHVKWYITLFFQFFLFIILANLYTFQSVAIPESNEFALWESNMPFYEIFLSNGQSYVLNLHLALDGISYCFVLLTVLLVTICLLISIDSITKKISLYCFMFLLLEFCLILAFMSIDLFFFYIFFEMILIPMFFLIIIWGSRVRKKLSAMLFFLYTAIGSFFILIGILMIIFETGSTDITILWDLKLPLVKQYFIWFFFFFGFCIKVPMFPVHLWLPEAHVEAPTSGSIILAGILLKLGGYGLLRFLLPICSNVHETCIPIVYLLALLSIFYASFVIIRQTDIKKIIAYSSIIHMNVGILGLFSLTQEGLQGSLLLMVGHGFISSGLFLLVGSLYERYGTRLVYYYSGLVYRMPIFVFFFFFFTLSNTSFPGTVNFVGEFLTFFGIFEYSVLSFLVSGFMVMFFGAFYSFWLFNRISFGELKSPSFGYFYDLNYKEIVSLIILMIGILVFGLSSGFFFDGLIGQSIVRLMFRIL